MCLQVMGIALVAQIFLWHKIVFCALDRDLTALTLEVLVKIVKAVQPNIQMRVIDAQMYVNTNTYCTLHTLVEILGIELVHQCSYLQGCEILVCS